MCRLHFMLKRHRNFRETFLRNYAQFQLQHPDWPQRTEQSLLSKFDAISRKIRKDSTAKFKFVSVSQVKGSKNGVSCKLSPNIEMLEEMTTRAISRVKCAFEKTEAQLETTMSLLHAQVSAERSRQDQLVRARARARVCVCVCVRVCVCVCVCGALNVCSFAKFARATRLTWCSCHAATRVSAKHAQVNCALAAVAAAHASVRNAVSHVFIV